MTKNQRSSSTFVKNLVIIHLAIFSGLFIFTAVSYFIRNTTEALLDPVQLEILTYISLMLLLINIPLGYWLHNKKMKGIVKNSDITIKLMTYQSSHIIKITLYEGVGFLSCIVLLLGGKDLILIQIAIILLFILLNTPSASKLADELDLSPDEIEMLNP
jgi:hypothetical protein